MLDHPAIQALAPSDAAFEETEAQLGEPPSHAAEEKRLGQRFAAFGEPADLVVLVARERAARSPTDGARVERRRHFELDALAPDRVVVERAVDAEAILIEHLLRQVGIRLAKWGTGRSTSPAKTAALRPSSPIAKSSSSMASSGVCIGITAVGGQAVAVRTEELRVVEVECPCTRAA